MAYAYKAIHFCGSLYQCIFIFLYIPQPHLLLFYQYLTAFHLTPLLSFMPSFLNISNRCWVPTIRLPSSKRVRTPLKSSCRPEGGSCMVACHFQKERNQFLLHSWLLRFFPSFTVNQLLYFLAKDAERRWSSVHESQLGKVPSLHWTESQSGTDHDENVQYQMNLFSVELRIMTCPVWESTLAFLLAILSRASSQKQ